MSMPPTELLKVEEVIKRLRIGRTKVYDLMNRNELEHIRIDGKRLIIAESVDALIARKRQERNNG